MSSHLHLFKSGLCAVTSLMRVAHRRRLKVKFINQTPFQMNQVRIAEGQNTIQISSVLRKNFFFLKNDIAYSDVSDRTILRIVYSSSSYLPFQSSSSNLDIRSILKALPAIHRHIQYACLHTLQIIYFLDQKSYFTGSKAKIIFTVYQ